MRESQREANIPLQLWLTISLRLVQVCAGVLLFLQRPQLPPVSRLCLTPAGLQDELGQHHQRGQGHQLLQGGKMLCLFWTMRHLSTLIGAELFACSCGIKVCGTICACSSHRHLPTPASGPYLATCRSLFYVCKVSMMLMATHVLVQLHATLTNYRSMYILFSLLAIMIVVMTGVMPHTVPLHWQINDPVFIVPLSFLVGGHLLAPPGESPVASCSLSDSACWL